MSELIPFTIIGLLLSDIVHVGFLFLLIGIYIIIFIKQYRHEALAQQGVKE